MGASIAMARKQKILGLAEAKALDLIKNNLTSTDPELQSICKKLERFKPLLAKGVDESQAKSLLQSGFAVCRYSPGTGTDEEEVLVLLGKLADKLGGMAAGLLGGLL